MVQVTDLGKAFQGFHMENIRFSLPAGYIMGLAGENGAGKTTLLKILSGLYSPDSGRAELFGIGYEDGEQTIKNQIGTVFHEEFFDPYETLEGNANRWGSYYSHYDSRLFLKTAERFGLEISKKVRQLSKGEKMKFYLAFALSHQPGLLLLDEPSANFDEDFQKEFKKVLQEFVSDGEHSVILSTHQTEDLEEIADYLLMLKDGKQVLFGDMETIRNRYCMVSGEAYKLRLIPKEWVIYKEDREFGSQALVSSMAGPFDPVLKVRKPRIAEIMYAYSKRKKEGASRWKI